MDGSTASSRNTVTDCSRIIHRGGRRGERESDCRLRGGGVIPGFAPDTRERSSWRRVATHWPQGPSQGAECGKSVPGRDSSQRKNQGGEAVMYMVGDKRGGEGRILYSSPRTTGDAHEGYLEAMSRMLWNDL